MDQVESDWIRKAGTIKKVADVCHPAYPIEFLFDESWNSKTVVLLITADESEGVRI